MQSYLVRTLIVDAFEYIDLALCRDVMKTLKHIFSEDMDIPRSANRDRPSRRQAMCCFATFNGRCRGQKQEAVTHPHPSGMCLMLNLNTPEG